MRSFHVTSSLRHEVKSLRNINALEAVSVFSPAAELMIQSGVVFPTFCMCYQRKYTFAAHLDQQMLCGCTRISNVIL